jgi:hypothetical protein
LIVSLSGDELYLKLAEFSGRMPPRPTSEFV